MAKYFSIKPVLWRWPLGWLGRSCSAKRALPLGPFRRRYWPQWRGVAVAAGGALALLGLAQAAGLLVALERGTLDWFFRRSRPAIVNPKVLVVTITDRDIDRIGVWPIPDGRLAAALEQLTRWRPAAIGVDLYRELPVGAGREALDRVFTRHSTIVGIEKVVAPSVPPAKALQRAGRVAAADVVLDADGKVRRALLGVGRADGSLQFSLGTRLALDDLARQGIALETLNEAAGLYGLGQARLQSLEPGKLGYALSDVGGYQVLLNYYGPPESFQQVTLSEVLEGRVDPRLVRDRVVFVGSTADSAKDFFNSPYSTPILGKHTHTPGVFIHANVFSYLVRAAQGQSPVLQPWSTGLFWVGTGLATGAGAAVTWWIYRRSGDRGGLAILGSLGAALGINGGWVGLGYASFVGGILLPVTTPVLGWIFATVLAALLHEQWRLQVANTLLAEANAALREYSTTLEDRVRERTAELEEAKLAADAANQAKSEFLANMSHELRTPLNGILGYAQILQQRLADSDQRSGVQTIYQCGRHLLTLIEDILDLAKIEARKLELQTADTDFQRFLAGIADLFVLRAQEKSLDFVTEFAPDLPERLRIDEKRLRQVLINLLGNAVKFTDRGQVVFRVKRLASEGAAADEADQRPAIAAFRFEVEDSGVGMTPAQLAKIFQPFEQVGDKSRQTQGTGLGLSIGQRLVELMGSEIEVQSTAGVGTCFGFTVELVVERRGAAAARGGLDTGPVRAAGGHSPTARRRRGAATTLLVLDRDASSRALIRDLLEPLDCAVLEATSLAAAEAQLATAHPAALIAELMLEDGRLEDRLPAWRNRGEEEPLRVVAFSASVFARDRDQAIAAGADVFLQKPLDIDLFLETLADLLAWEWIVSDNLDTMGTPAQLPWPVSPAVGLASARPNPQEITPNHSFTPSLAELRLLADLANMGDIYGIKEHLQTLQERDSRMQQFSSELVNLVDGFEIKKIQTLIKDYMERAA